MALFDIDHTWIFTFGVLGNVDSFLLFLAPVPTFWKIYKAKSTMGFDPLPYATALMSALLWLYYAMLTTDTVLIITVNLFGSIVETAYLIIFNIYANKEARARAAKILGAMIGLLFLIFAVTFFVFKGQTRAKVVGWVCVALSICVFASPLMIIAKVVKTRSVEYMPFQLSFFLTLNAAMWFGYGLAKKDYYVAFPNVGGICLSMVQMLLYLIYRNKTPLEKDIEKNINVVNFKVVGTPDIQGTAAPVVPPAQITVQAPLNAVGAAS